MRGAIPPLPQQPSWHGGQFKKKTGITLPLPYFEGWVKFLEKCQVHGFLELLHRNQLHAAESFFRS
jgi:hypothetical protein